MPARYSYSTSSQNNVFCPAPIKTDLLPWLYRIPGQLKSPHMRFFTISTSVNKIESLPLQAVHTRLPWRVRTDHTPPLIIHPPILSNQVPLPFFLIVFPKRQTLQEVIAQVRTGLASAHYRDLSLSSPLWSQFGLIRCIQLPSSSQ
jgi:hypothetical protein